MRVIIILVFFSSFLFGENTCGSLKVNLDEFTTQIESLKNREPDPSFYDGLDNQYYDLTANLKSNICAEQTDSLRLMLMLYYSEFVVKSQGDLERYQILLRQVHKLMVVYIEELGEKLDLLGESRDEIRENWSPRLQYISEALDQIDRNYKPMTVKILRRDNRIFTEMTKVLTYDGKDYAPVQVHFRPPKDIFSDDIKRRRLMYLTSKYELVLTSYNTVDGFYFDIPLVPLSNKMRIRPEDTYAITFNQNLRYRINKFNQVNQDTLMIEPDENWVFRSLVPTTFSKIQIPSKLNYYIYDKNQNIVLDKSLFTVVDGGDTSNLYLPNDPDLNYELRLQSKKNGRLLFLVTLLSLVTIIGGGVYVSVL